MQYEILMAIRGESPEAVKQIAREVATIAQEKGFECELGKPIARESADMPVDKPEEPSRTFDAGAQAV